MAAHMNYVGLRIGNETFGVGIETVYEIVRMAQITVVPEAPDWVEGIINLRGQIIPVIDLRKRFGEDHITAHKKNRIVVVDVGGKRVGLVVDAASEVLKIPPDEIEPPPDIFEDVEAGYVTGVAKFSERLIILVDLNKIMRRGELKHLDTALLTAQASVTEAATN